MGRLLRDRTEGRALYAAVRTLPVPTGPLARLWHGASLRREHRRETDLALGRLIQTVKGLDLFGRTTWVVTGDHGMTGWNTPMAAQAIAALATVGFTPEVIAPGGRASPDTDVVLVSGGSIVSVHLLGALATDAAAIDRARTTLADVEGVATELTKADQAELLMGPQYGQLLLELAAPYALSFNPPAEGFDGRHGSRAETKVPLILSGHRIRPGKAPQNPHHVDLPQRCRRSSGSSHPDSPRAGYYESRCCSDPPTVRRQPDVTAADADPGGPRNLESTRRSQPRPEGCGAPRGRTRCRCSPTERLSGDTV